LIDEMLNAVLFLLIGLEIIVVIPQPQLLVLGVAAVPLALFARSASVGAPFLSPHVRRLPRGAFTMLVIGGVRGGISIALALSIPEGPHKAAIVMATYVVVLFSVLVQSSLVGAVAERLFPNRKAVRK